MKRLFTLFVAMLLLFASSCKKYDDSALTKRVDELGDRVQQLENLCEQMNTNIALLQTLIMAVQQGDYVQSVTPLAEGGEIIGYVIAFTKSAPITIYHGKDATSGEGDAAPAVGVKQDTDGIFYWTLDGEWLTDQATGAKIKVQEAKDGITPKLKIEDGYWLISYDDEQSWTELGQATGEDGKDGDTMFQSVTEDEYNVYLTLADGEEITLAKKPALAIRFEEGETVSFFANEKKTLHYTITGGSENNVVKAVMQNEDGAYTLHTVATSDSTGTIEIKAGTPTVNKVVVFVSDGGTMIMATVNLERSKIVITMVKAGTLGDVLKGYDEDILTDLVINGSMNAQDIAALAQLPALSTLDIENTDLTVIPAKAFLDNRSLTSIELPKGLKTIGREAFSSCSNLTCELTLPKGVTNISAGAFMGCNFTGHLTIPEGVTVIDTMAFAYCDFTGITISEGVTTIKLQAFCECKYIEGELIIPKSVTTIEDEAFFAWKRIQSVVISEGVKTIGYGQFRHNSKCEVFYCKATTPPQLVDGKGNSSLPFMPQRTLYVPRGCAEAYRTAPVWSEIDFKEIIEMDF